MAGTTFAAANPFSDVPTDHWSFDAVAKLAQQGVIEGYGDSTFRGDAHITRYEMAQMVAKAMAKDLSGADKTTVDKLAAEYADELNNLGVRVANLEKKSDNVQFQGLIQLDGIHKKIDNVNDGSTVTAKIRLDMTAFVNEDWSAKARLDGDMDLDNGNTNAADGGNDEKITAKRIYAAGPLFGADAKLGKFDMFDSANLTNGGLIIDTDASGAEFAWRGAKWNTTLTAGRIDDDSYGYASEGIAGTSDYLAIQFGYAPSEKWRLAAGYHNLRNNVAFEGGDEDKNGIWSFGADYKFTPDLTLGGLYAAGSADAERSGLDSGEEKSYSVQLMYKGAKSDVENSYGIWAAYRQVGQLASIASTYDGVGYGEKGFELGADYMIAKNILTKLIYFNGEEISSGADVEKVFGRVEFQF